MRKVVLYALLASTLMLAGCANYWNTVARDGGMFGSYNGDWVVVKYSGGKIMDVWKLQNSLVQSEEHSDGWLFQDNDGNAVNIGGDTKHFRINNRSDKASLWNQYHEYHFDVQGGSYETTK